MDDSRAALEVHVGRSRKTASIRGARYFRGGRHPANLTNNHLLDLEQIWRCIYQVALIKRTLNYCEFIDQDKKAIENV